MLISKCYQPEEKGVTSCKHVLRASAGLFLGTLFALGMASTPSLAQSAATTLIVAGPRTPESLDQEYPPTEAVHEVRRNVYERLLAYAPKTGEDEIVYEDFSKIVGALADKYEVSDDKKSITFHLRKDVVSSAGNPLTADDVMWSFERGWNLKANFHWYMTQILKIESFEKAFTKVDDFTVTVTIPNSSPLLDRLWINSDLGILDATEMRKVAVQSFSVVWALLCDEIYPRSGSDLRSEREILSWRPQTEEDHL